MRLVLLVLFIAFNVFAIRFIIRWVWSASEELRDRDTRDKAIQEYGRDEGLEMLTWHFHPSNTQNPVQRVIIILGLLGSLLVADYHTIQRLWPGLLP